MKRIHETATLWASIGLLLLIVVLPGAGFAQDNETCLACHAEPDLTGLDAHGNELSMFVAQASVDSSVHAGFSCVDCHQDLAGVEDYPHEETLRPADCATCHDDVAELYSASAHHTDNPNAPSCASCHGTHNILSDLNPEAMTSASRLPYTCSNCHSRQTLKDDPDIMIADSFDNGLYTAVAYAEAFTGHSADVSLSTCSSVERHVPNDDIFFGRKSCASWWVDDDLASR